MSDIEQTGTTWSVDALATVEAAVLAVPGVSELYRARPTITSAVTAVRHGTTPANLPRIVVDGAVLRVVIGTDGFVPAPQVARAVHDAALAEGVRLGVTLTRVDVRIARVG
jgi:hypothetical protein